MHTKSGNGMEAQAEGQEAVPFHTLVGALFFLAAIFFLNFLGRIILAPLLPPIEKELVITHRDAGSLFFLISIGYFFTLLGSGFVSSRLGHRKAIILSAGAVGGALLAISFLSSLWGIRIGLLVLGMAAGLYLPSGIATLTSLISPKYWGRALAIHELAPNLGFVAAPLLSEALLHWVSWRGVLALVGIASLLTGVTYARFGRGGRFPGQAPSLGSFGLLLREPSFWLMVLLFSLGIAGSMGVFTMLPLYLVTERGLERDWANTLIALSRVSGIGTAFLAGWASDRLGPRRTLMGVLLFVGLSTLGMGVAPGSWLLAAVFLQPMLAVCFFPAGFAALSSIGPGKVRDVAVSLAIPLAIIFGGGLIPILIGTMGDAGSFASGFVLVGGLIMAGAMPAWLLKFPERK